jgi:hypothetical protein
MKSYLKTFIALIIKNKQFNLLLFCLFLSFALWLSITYSKTYEHIIVYPIAFVDNNHKATMYSVSDSTISVNVKANGFEFLLNRGYSKHNKKIIFDINKLLINSTRSYIKIPTSMLKGKIINAIGYKNVNIAVSPDTITIAWIKTFSKKVPLINKTNFHFKKPYQAYSPIELMNKYIIIEGSKKDLDRIDTIFTENVSFNNINRNCIMFVPLDLTNISKNVNIPMKQVLVRIRAEKYTENIVKLPINVIRYESYKNIKVLPKEVRIRYRVAIKDYKKINTADFNAYVVCSNENLAKKNRLKVFIGNVPSLVNIVSVMPDKVEYILFK